MQMIANDIAGIAETVACQKRQALETVPGLRGVEEIIDEDRCRYQLVIMDK